MSRGELFKGNCSGVRGYLSSREFFKSNCPGGKKSVGDCLGGNFIGGNCPGGGFPGGNYLVVIVRGDNSHLL